MQSSARNQLNVAYIPYCGWGCTFVKPQWTVSELHVTMNISYSLLPLRSVASLTPLWSSFSQNKRAQLTGKLWGSAFVTFAFLCFVKHASVFAHFEPVLNKELLALKYNHPFFRFWWATVEQWTTGRKRNTGSSIQMQGTTSSLSEWQRNRQPREAAESPCLEIFKTQLGDLLQGTCLAEGGTTWSPEFPSNPCSSVNLWFYKPETKAKNIDIMCNWDVHLEFLFYLSFSFFFFLKNISY